MTEKPFERRRSDFTVAQLDQLHSVVKAAVSEEVANITRRITGIEGELKRNSGDTATVLDIVDTAKKGFKLMYWLGLAARWMSGLIASWYVIEKFFLRK